MELVTSVQGYVIVRELCHTVEKSYTKAFFLGGVAHRTPQRRTNTRC